MASVGYSCSVRTCKKVGYVEVREMIKAGKELLPKGWIRYDIGDVGPEEYTLCNKHKSEYLQEEDNLLRNFVKAPTNKGESK